MAKPECRTLGYKLIGEYVFSEIIADFIRDENWDMAKHSVKATQSALESSLEEGFINTEQLKFLSQGLARVDLAVKMKDKKEADTEFGHFFTDYGTVIIDAIAECECRRR